MEKLFYNYESIKEELVQALATVPSLSLKMVIAGLERLQKSNWSRYDELKDTYTTFKAYELPFLSYIALYLKERCNIVIKLKVTNNLPVFEVGKFENDLSTFDKGFFDSFASFIASKKAEDKKDSKKPEKNPAKEIDKLIDLLNVKQVDTDGVKFVDKLLAKIKPLTTTYKGLDLLDKLYAYGLLGKVESLVNAYEDKQREKALAKAVKAKAKAKAA